MSSIPRPVAPIVSIAPMLDLTDEDYRYLARLMSKKVQLYTEMMVDMTIIHNPSYHKPVKDYEHPIVCQLGGNNPSSLAQASKIMYGLGYDEINLNCGCPSPRVAGKGCFGASLMFTPELVRDCVIAMRGAVEDKIPITVKCRLGVDNQETYEAFRNFVDIVHEGGCRHFIIHARKAILKGLNPKGNRSVPPLRYHWAQRIALERPHIRFSLNGGVTLASQIEELLCLVREPVEGSTNPAEGAIHIESISPPVSPRELRRQAREQKEAREAVKNSENVEKSSVIVENESKGDNGSDAGSTCGGDECAAVNPTESENCTPESERKAVFRSGILTRLQKARHDAVFGKLPPEQFEHGVFKTTPVAGEYGTDLHVLDSVMIGRAAYHQSWILSDVDRRFFNTPNPGHSRREVINMYLDYVIKKAGGRENMKKSGFDYIKPLLGLFAGEFGHVRFKHEIGQAFLRKATIEEALEAGYQKLPPFALDERPPSTPYVYNPRAWEDEIAFQQSLREAELKEATVIEEETSLVEKVGE